MKALSVLSAVLLLSGCAAMDNSKDTRLNSLSGITYENNGKYETIKTYVKNREGKLNKDRVKLCIARNITNNSIQLKDSSASFVGAYTGNYYNIEKSTVTQGGEVINTAASSSDVIISNGTVSYQYDAGLVMVERVVKFTMDITPAQSGVKYTFSNLQQAQTETGVVSNNGFSPIGVWKAAGGYQAINALDNISFEINKCMSEN
ncbi:TPA: hypothetical protein RQ363_005360 [Klebsiella oxytoca]|uniref:hypothetical protein n=1 Tax=Klebsiella TaxID=570 RepID=UPI000E2C9EEE|nr:MULTISPECIES: hypothetical protein [Klebsiella]HDU3753722.1 hypothetical protein [Klebsiella pneumoniae subsp. pneumoniae]MBV2041901.1 hypothetical protein [Klebsiella pneumoniae]MBV2048880.1 hypothetical protein [Klebsiella pneumoniae]MBV2061598.1 hypothetical protein [Klebsiella pneumoniae]MBV2075912.1 hypothetical protein [Klebsiella pneumoniae]